MEELDGMTIIYGRIDTLYRFFDSLSPRPLDFDITYGVLNENNINTCGIFIKGGNPSNLERSVSTGEQLVRRAFVSFNILGNPEGDEGTINAFSFCEEYISVLEKTFNTMYTSDTGKTLYIQRMDIMGDVNDLGLNKFQTPVFSFNIVIYYKEVN